MCIYLVPSYIYIHTHAEVQQGYRNIYVDILFVFSPLMYIYMYMYMCVYIYTALRNFSKVVTSAAAVVRAQQEGNAGGDAGRRVVGGEVEERDRVVDKIEARKIEQRELVCMWRQVLAGR